MKYLGAITSDYDLVNKKYVDDSIPTVPTITLNGGTTSSPNFYAPLGAGTSGQYLKSNGSDPPSWASFPTIPSITLNGSSTTSPSFYAPTSVGTSGYVLKSNGSGAPTWTSATLTDTQVTSTTVTAATTFYPAGSTSSSTATGGLSKHASIVAYVSANTSATGYSRLTLGNSTASGTAGAKYGELRLYQEGAHVTSLRATTVSDADITSYLPARSGTIENGFVSVSSVSSFSATNNTFTAARNGIFIFNMRASAASAYIGIQDTHDSVYMAQQTIPNNGNYASVCFPVLSGRQYKIIQATNLTSTSAYVIYFG